MIKLINRTRGFSLVEVIIVIGMFSLLISLSGAIYSQVTAMSQLNVATNSIVESLRSAQTRASQVNGGVEWGVKISPAKVTIFKGSSYTSRDQSADQVFALSGGIVSSGLSEVVFTPVFGNPTTTGTITLSRSTETKNIILNEKGTLTY